MKPEAPASRRLRLDELLVERGLFASRSRARDAIERATVRVDGEVAVKPGRTVAADAVLEIDDPARAFVSRAALKLIAGLDGFGFDPAGCTERGAAHVTAIDVGHGQMRGEIEADPRVASMEGLNARDLTAADLGGRVPDFIVSDVSFISLKLALPPALELAAPGARAVLLVKPQFEAGREAIGKGGLLKNPDDAERVACSLRDWLDGQPGWLALGLSPSPIEGGDGNREFLLAGVKDR
jgi:23S rRNA (cytidine1920-2'-O)/16S rRNA (cytidine1409-2'-O)-methyltransferase